MRYVLGLDIGSTSVGWAVGNLDPYRLEDLGVRGFNAAENPKDKSSLALPRRLARSARRRLRRRAGRLQRIRKLFADFGLMADAELDTAFIKHEPTPWQLRAEGLDRLLSGEELGRALYHIAKRRGFKSNRKSETPADIESRKMLSGIAGMSKMMAEKGWRTVGEMFARDPQFQDRKRNRDQDYSHTVERAMLEDEVRALFAAQRRLGSSFASPEFEEHFRELFLWQKPFASADEILSKVGPCTFEPDERRAPRSSYTAERFGLLQKLANLEIVCNGERRRLTPEERQTVDQMAYTLEKVTYEQIRKKLGLSEDARFAGSDLRYLRRKEGRLVEDRDCEKSTFRTLSGYHALRKAFAPAGLWDTVKSDPDLMDDIAFALTFYKTDEDIRAYLAERGLPEPIIDAAAAAPTFSKVVHLSVKAMRKIIPHLAEGLRYDQARAAAGYSHYNPRGDTERSRKLPVIDRQQMSNPVVLRALAQARKVVNHIVDRYGPPTYVNIELARDIAKSAERRNKIDRRNKENAAAREEDDQHFKEFFGADPKGEDRVKWRLYREQNGQCAYSQQPLDLKRLLEQDYVEIDHILPYSRSFDSRMSNRVLVLSAENRNKGDRTPHEYFGSIPERWARFEEWVRATIRDRDKRANLLTKDFAARQDEWMQRSLTDTQYAARFFAEVVRRHLLFADPEVKQPVRCFAGGVTALARGLWGLAKHREEDDLHHALDAAVIAALTPGRIKFISDYSKARECGRVTEVLDEETGEIYEIFRDKPFWFPEPWKGFRKELRARLSDDPAAAIAELKLESYAEDPPQVRPVIVSRMPIRKASGALHAETIRSVRERDGKRVSVVRRKLTDLTQADLAKLYAPESNRELYALIRARMEQHNFVGKKAFAEPLHKPSKPGRKAPIVRSVKVCEAQPSGIPVRGGVADNENMVRTDVFTKDGKYYLVPVYVSHIAAGKLPERAVKSGALEEEWPVMDSSYQFLFCLHPYDLVRVITTSGGFTGYFRGINRNNGVLKLSEPNNNASDLRTFGARTALLVEKYSVGVLGEIHRVGREERVGVAMRGDRKSGPAEDSG